MIRLQPALRSTVYSTSTYGYGYDTCDTYDTYDTYQYFPSSPIGLDYFVEGYSSCCTPRTRPLHVHVLTLRQQQQQ